jgi:site-specific recombinase XerD
MMARINVVAERERLSTRREPYYVSLGSGRHLGFRKMSNSGSWLAKHRDEATGKRTTKALGKFDHLPASERYDAAKTDAEIWFKLLNCGVERTDYTITDMCNGYVQYISTHRGEDADKDVARRFKQYVLNDEKFANTELTKLKQKQVENWRTKLAKTPLKIQRKLREGEISPDPKFRTSSTLNRDMTCLRAALNWALERSWIQSDQPWRIALKAIKNADKQRQLIVTREDVELMILKAKPEIVPFLQALTYLPLRPGALAKLTVSNFQQKESILKIGVDKNHSERRISLPPITSDFFKHQVKGRSPNEPLLPRANGKHWDNASWKVLVNEAAEAAGLSAEVTLYQFRHLAITSLAQNGADLLSVAKLGGTSLRMIENYYGHLVPEHSVNLLTILSGNKKQ